MSAVVIILITAGGVMIGLIAAVVLIPLRIRVTLKAREELSDIRFTVFAAGLIPFAFRFRAVYSLGRGLYFARVTTRNSEEVLYRLEKKKKTKKSKHYPVSLLDAGKLTHLNIYARLGVGDAAQSVYAAQALNIVLNSAKNFFLERKSNAKSIKGDICVIPMCAEKTFILNMECILRCFVPKLIREIAQKKRGNTNKGNNERKTKLCTQSKT